MRRIATVAAVALLAVGGLSACRVESGTALFVGDDRVEQSRVDDMVDMAPAGNETASVRKAVVTWLAVVELAKHVADDQHLPLPGPDYAASAAAIGSTGNDLTRLKAEYEAYLPFLYSTASPVTPTKELATAGLNDIEAVTGEKIPDSYADVLVDGLTQATDGAEALGKRERLAALFESYDVLTNPRYGHLSVKIGDVPVVQGTIPLIAAIPTSTTP